MTRRRILIAAVLTLCWWGLDFACAIPPLRDIPPPPVSTYAAPPPLRPDDGKDDTLALLEALGRSRVLTLKEGDYELDYKKLKNRPELARFTLIGAAPATAWPQRHPHQKNYATRLKFPGAPPHEWLLDLTTPKGQMAGPQQLINLDIYRDTPGNGFRFRGEDEFSVETTPARGLLIRDCSFSCGGNHWPGSFKGGELPDVRGTALELVHQADARIEGVSCWGFEDQLVLRNCDNARITDWHGGNCARSIVVAEGLTPARITNPVIENVIVSGIDFTCAKVRGGTVEVGYQTSIGLSALPKELKWQLHEGWGVISTEGPDLRKWLPERSVIRLAGKLLYVDRVDADRIPKDGPELYRGWFTFYLWNSHCRLGDMHGDGSEITRLLGVNYIVRGDHITLDDCQPNLNAKRPGLPMAAFFPFRSPQIVRDFSPGGIGLWDDDFNSNAAVVGGWHEQAHEYGGSVLWHGPGWLRPDHPWVVGPDHGRMLRDRRPK